MESVERVVNLLMPSPDSAPLHPGYDVCQWVERRNVARME
jgi:hypothetical protein